MAILLVLSFCCFIHNNIRQMAKPATILEATLKVKLDPKVDHCMASGVVDQMTITDKKTK